MVMNDDWEEGGAGDPFKVKAKSDEVTSLLPVVATTGKLWE